MADASRFMEQATASPPWLESWPYGWYGVEYIGLVSLTSKPRQVKSHMINRDLLLAAYVL